ncbi:MAG TPA: PhoH family protein [Luteibaculaceae bacterium]|nr:PhoH family protein [Luteibaculaceae bacterium]
MRVYLKKKRMAKRIKKGTKIFVLDTSVILHDHNSIFNFQEHDVAIPIIVLEELDNFKRGNDSKNYEAREAIRIIDNLASEYTLDDWIPLRAKQNSRLKVLFNEHLSKVDAERVFDEKKADHKILNTALDLCAKEPGRQVILVSKDINLRLKAKALGLQAEDYLTGKVKNVKELFNGIDIIDNADSEDIKRVFNSKKTEDLTLIKDRLVANHFYIIKNGTSSLLAYYNPFDETIERVEKQLVYGIKPRNAEQTFAIHAILNPEIKLVTLAGVAGTGKTLLALAGAIEQKNKYKQIYLARPIVPLSNKEIGYLPGDAHEKVNPYMAPLWDNLSFIKNQYKPTEKKYMAIQEMQNEGQIVVTPLAFIRGRSLSDTIFIVDEAQNLTPHEVKTIITRAGQNTKIIFTGDVNQIDTPYLDDQSNGMSYIIDRLKGQKLFAHITLEKGERSELANLANDLL